MVAVGVDHGGDDDEVDVDVDDLEDDDIDDMSLASDDIEMVGEEVMEHSHSIVEGGEGWGLV